MAAGFGAFLGHLFPVWLGFKGGKGVATYLGVLLGLAWQVALIFAVVWLARRLPVPLLLAGGAGGGRRRADRALFPGHTADCRRCLLVMSLIVFIKHRANISRLLAGTEGKIGAKG